MQLFIKVSFSQISNSSCIHLKMFMRGWLYVMVKYTCVCVCFAGTWHSDIWSDSILGVSVRVFVDEMKARLPFIMWWDLYNQLKS